MKKPSSSPCLHQTPTGRRLISKDIHLPVLCNYAQEHGFTVAEKEYYMTTAYLIELGSRSSDIFSRSKLHEKRALLNFVL